MATAVSENTGLRLTAEETTELKEKARWLRRIANPFVDLYVITAIGAAGTPSTAQSAQRCEDNQTRDYSKNLTAIQRKIYTEDFEQMISHLPFLKSRLESNETSQIIRKIINKVQSVADQAKQSDTKNVKYGIVTLIPSRYFPQDCEGNTAANAHRYINVKDPGKLKSWRGWNNRITSRLLCPVDYINQFDANPDDATEKLVDGLLTLNDTAGDPKLPAFLYDEDMRDGSLTTGLFRGPLLLAVYTSIFISPSGATGEKVSSKRGNAKIHGMGSVIPSTICYAAIHTYMALCCREAWGEAWKGVKLPRLYILLREQLAYQDDPWCVETIKWWNGKVFNDSEETGTDPSETSRDAEGPSTRERTDNERRRRMEAMSGNQN